MKQLSTICAALLLGLLAHGVSSSSVRAGSPGLADYRYQLTPFDEDAAALTTAMTALETGDQVTEAHAVVSGWLAAADDRVDPWEMDLARVLALRLTASMGQTRQAVEGLEAHLRGGGAHQDMARKSLATLYREQGEHGHWFESELGLTSGPLAHAKRIETAAAANKPALRVGPLTEVLRRPWSPDGRRRLTEALLSALEAAGEEKDAIERLRRLWWRATGEHSRQRWFDRLSSLDAAPDFGQRVARLVLKTKRSRLRSARRALKRLRPRSAHQRRIVVWGRAVLDRLEPGLRARALRQLKKVSRRLRRTSFAPVFLFGQAEALRKVGRDEEAAEHYEALAADHPSHWLATEALVEAGGLRMWIDQPAAGFQRYRAAAERPDHGGAHREALWRAGLGAFMVGEYEDAGRRFDRLVVQYGGVRDGIGLTWLSRALYWSGRVAAAQGDAATAEARYRTVARRFSAGWYGTLARARLDAMGVVLEVHEADVVHWASPLDTAVLAMRVGRLEDAVGLLDGLMRADQIAGQGRALLASALHALDRGKEASSIRTRYGIPMMRPTVGENEAYGALYPMPYRDLVLQAATEGVVPPGLLAGLIHVESRYEPHAKSGAGAVGLCQLLPSTARVVGRRLMGQRITGRTLRDPETNVRLGARFLGALWSHFKAHPALALAAYNAGRGAARSWLRVRGHLPTDLFVETIPYDQARRYVKRVVAVSEHYRRLYGLADEDAALQVPLRLPTVLAPYVLEEPLAPPPEPVKAPEVSVDVVKPVDSDTSDASHASDTSDTSDTSDASDASDAETTEDTQDGGDETEVGP